MNPVRTFHPGPEYGMRRGSARRMWPALVVLTAMLAPATALSAQTLSGSPLSVSEATGQAEIRVPETGWRRAVVGRPVSSGSNVTSWVESSVRIEGTIGEAAVRFELRGLSHVSLDRSDEEGVVLTLSAGTLSAETERQLTVAVRTPSARNAGRLAMHGEDAFPLTKLSTGGARFRVNTRSVVLEEGRLRITNPDGSSRSIEQPGTYQLGLHQPGPVFRRQD